MKSMPAFCHFWHMAPADMLRLTVAEYRALCAYQERYQRDEQRAMAEVRALTHG